MLLRYVIATVVLFSWVVRAQSAAELYGVVRDTTEAAVANARVTLLNQDTGAEQTYITGTGGEYHFFAVPPGEYTIIVVSSGFPSLRRSGLRIHIGERLPLDLRLSIGARTDVVSVTAAAPLLQSSRGDVAFTVDTRQVVSLPLDSRNFVPLLALSPGVMLPPGQVLPRINGSRPRVNEYLYDGISVLQPEPGQVAYFPVLDSIAEFRLELNSYPAEYGRANGGIILVSTRSGTNDYHGTLFEYLRNEIWNARNLFAPPGPKLPFKRNQYGLAAGGPLQRNKTFLFADYQGANTRTGVVRFSTVPVTAERQGLFSTPVFDPVTTRRTSAGVLRDPFPGNEIRPGRFDPVARNLLDRYPVPNVFGAAGQELTANNYRRSGTEPTGDQQFDLRLDRYFGERHRIFGRYSYFNEDARPLTPLPGGSGLLSSGVIGDTLTRAGGVMMEHTWTLSARSVNQVRAGYTRRDLHRSELDSGNDSGVPGIPKALLSGVFPVFDITGFQQLGPASSANASLATSVFQLVDTFSRQISSHTAKFGLDLRDEHLDVIQPGNPGGSFQFTPTLTAALDANGAPRTASGSSVASFLLGEVQAFSQDAQQGILRPRAHIAEWFAQDDWRAADRVTINLGVRHTLNFPSTEAADRGAVFDLYTQKLKYLGNNGNPRSARDLELHNFAPRLGIAVRLTSSTAVRAGYGLIWIEQAGITTPFTTPLFPFVQTITQRSLDNLSPAFLLSEGPTVQLAPPRPDSGLGQGVFGVQRDNGSGYAQQWNASVQQTFGKNWTAEAGYAGSKLTRLGVPDTNLNQLRVEQLSLGSRLTESVPNPFYGIVPISSPLGAPAIPRQQLLRPYPMFTTVALYRNNVGHSTYHALLLRLERRLSRGLTVTAAYSFSKLIDDAGAVFDSAVLTGPVLNYQAADSFNRHLEKDESTGSIPHVFATSFVYELPFASNRRFAGGWRLAGTVRLQSGSPVAVTQATNLNAFAGFGIQRPNRVGDPQLPAGRRTTAVYFNTAAFTAAPQFTIGNSSRNPVRGPGFEDADLMLSKNFRLAEKWTAALRIECYNVSNTPPLGNPNGSFGSNAFGSITTALDPRVFQAAVRLNF